MGKVIGKRIREARLGFQWGNGRRGLDQAELAAMIGKSRRVISDYECGNVHRIPDTVLRDIAEALCIDYYQLTGKTDPANRIKANGAYTHAHASAMALEVNSERIRIGDVGVLSTYIAGEPHNTGFGGDMSNEADDRITVDVLLEKAAGFHSAIADHNERQQPDQGKHYIPRDAAQNDDWKLVLVGTGLILLVCVLLAVWSGF